MKTTITNSLGRLSPLAAVLLLAPLAGQAQTTFSFGPRVGVSFTNVKIDSEEDEDVIDTKNRTGVQVGLAASIGSGHFSFQPAVLYSQRGFRIEETETDNSGGTPASLKIENNTTFNYLEIPLQAAYSQNEDGTGIQLLLGPYLGVGLNGKSKSKITVTEQGVTETETDNTDFKFDGDGDANDDDEHLNRFDAGLSAGIGYRYQGFMLQGGYSLGLLDIIPKSDDSDEFSVKNRAFQISLTYFLQSK